MNWYFSNGERWTGKVHKMPNGETHSGETHTDESRRVFRMSQLTGAAKERARGGNNGSY